MYSRKQIDLARLSLFSYDYFQFNRTGIPDGWDLVVKSSNADSGFQAYAFKNETTNELVVSFTGTRFHPDEPIDVDWQTNVAGSMGSVVPFGAGQFSDAVAFMRMLMEADPGILSDAQKENIMFTGHSLGGGLANFMGVVFDRPALGFAPAPFEGMAKNSSVLEYLSDVYLAGFTRHGDAIRVLADAAKTGGDSLESMISSREIRSHSIAIGGELVTLPMHSEDAIDYLAALLPVAGAAGSVIVSASDNFKAIQSLAPWLMIAALPALHPYLRAGLAFVDGEDLYLGDQNFSWIDVGEWGGLRQKEVQHGMAWHLALMESEQLLEAVARVPDMAPIIASENYFGGSGYLDDKQDVLLRVINNNYGTSGHDEGLVYASDWLDSFAQQMLDISSHVAVGDRSDAISGLVSIVAEHYHQAENGQSVQPILTATAGGLHADLDLVRGVAPQNVLGVTRHFMADILADIPASQKTQSARVVAEIAATDWYVQLGSTALQVVGDGQNEGFLGGEQTDDWLNGGAGRDLLLGRAGDDTLSGGVGSDLLIGGAGNDTYVYASGDGVDQIIDLDGSGRLQVNGKVLTGGESVLAVNRRPTWVDRENGIFFQFQAYPETETYGRLFVYGPGLGGDGNRVTLENFRLHPFGESRASDFGLTFTDKPRVGIFSGLLPANPFSGIASLDEASILELSEGASSAVSVAVNSVVDYARTVQVTFPGSEGLFITLGDVRQALDGTPVDITIPAGQSMVVVGLSQEGDVDGALAPLALQAALVDGDATATHAMTLNIRGVTEDYAAPVAVSAIGYGDFSNSAHGIRIDGVPTVLGSAYRDVVTGVGSAGQVIGLGGDDALFVGGEVAEAALLATEPVAGVAAGALLSGAQGNDLAVGAEGADTLLGGGEQDRLYGQAGADLLLGDFVVGVDGAVALERRQSTFLDADNAAHAVLDRGAWQIAVGFSGGGWDAGASDRLLGGTGEDMLFGDGGDDQLDGGADSDYLEGGAGNDMLLGGAGDDHLVGTGSFVTGMDAGGFAFGNDDDSADFLDGGDGNDLLRGGGGADALFGGAGHDRLRGDDGELYGDDYLDGEDGNDVLLGMQGSDILLGGSGDDLLVADAPDSGLALHGNDTLHGEAGNDRLFGMGGMDSLSGGDGNDVLVGDVATDAGITDYAAGDADWLDGGAGDDALNGLGGDDELAGGSGADRLAGDAGNDYLSGGDDDDVLLGDNSLSVLAAEHHGDDIIDAGDGNDIVRGNGGADTVFGGGGNDLIHGDDTGVSGNDTLHGGAGQDIVAGDGGDDVLYGGDGDDQLHGDGGDVAAADQGADALYGEAGADQLVGYGGNDVLDGGGDDDALAGGAGHDVLVGGIGNDYLEGNSGDDVLDGGTGNDVYFVANGDGVDTLRDEEGTDTLVFGPGLSVDDLTFSLGSLAIGFTGSDTVVHIEGMNPNDVSGTAAIERIGFQSTANGPATLWALADLLAAKGMTLVGGGWQTGTNIVDHMTGSDEADWLIAGGGNDNIVALAGDDQVMAGDGNDTVQGGAGTDWLYGGAGDDQLQGDDGDDWLHGEEGADHLGGGDGADALFGGDGMDVMVGGAGADTLVGGVGNDLYYVDDAGDRVQEEANEGVDRVVASVDSTLADAVEELVLADVALAGTGNSLDNVLIGNAADNTLLGGDGVDTLQGNDGADLLDGGLGADLMAGGAGDDRYRVDTAGDSVVELIGEGHDTVEASVNHSLAENLEDLVLTGDALIGMGNYRDNVITGNDAANVLAGGAAQYGYVGQILNVSDQSGDVLVGGAGDDSYWVSHATDIVEFDGEGLDQVHLFSVDSTFRLPDFVENLRVESARAGIRSYYGNDLDNVITGTGASEIVYGGSGNDLLLTGFGEDTLDGGYGSDVMDGGRNADLYYVDHVNDVVSEEGNFEYTPVTDLVYASASFTLGAWIENLTLTGTDNLDGKGNDINNIITGNSGVNVLRGGDAGDTLYGGAGDDLLYGDNGDDILDGGVGGDALSGGLGDDVYYVDGSLDQVSEQANSGNDTVVAGIDAYRLTDNVENLQLAEFAGVVTGHGNAGANFLYGNAQGNQLHGGRGNDTLHGEQGDDHYFLAADGSHDLIRDGSEQWLAGGNDTLWFGEGLTRSSLQLRDGTVSHPGMIVGERLLTGSFVSGSGELTAMFSVARWFEDAYTVEAFRFADGDFITRDDVLWALSNHAPVTTADASSVLEDSFVDSVGNVLINDADDRTGTAGLTVTGLATGMPPPPIVVQPPLPPVPPPPGIYPPGYIPQPGMPPSGAADIPIVAGVGTNLGRYGTLQLEADGSYRYVLNNALPAVQALLPGQVLTEKFQYTVSDNEPLVTRTATGVLTVTVTGTSEVPRTVADATLVVEDGTLLASGSLLANDIDLPGGSQIATSDIGVRDGAFGSLTLTADGSFTYALSNDGEIVQSLSAGERAQDVFEYAVVAGSTVLASALTVDVVGVNDDPVVTGTVADVLAVAEETLTIALPSDLFRDADRLDVLDVSVAQASGEPLPAWLVFDAQAGAFSGLPTASDVGELQIRVTATDPQGATTWSEFQVTIEAAASVGMELTGTAQADSLVASDGDDVLDGRAGIDYLVGGAGNDTYYVDDFVWVSPGNEGLGNGYEAPPPGHEQNQNDFPGAAPGRPGQAGPALMRALAWLSDMADPGERAFPVTDAVVELADDGVDRVYSSVSHALADNVEELVLTGSAMLAGAGNTADNLLVGNAGFNALFGLSGDDWLQGQGGDDSLLGGEGLDILDGGLGNDLLMDAGAGDLLIGGAGQDVLQGGVTNQMHVGGAGNDTVLLAGGVDVVLFNRGDGLDRIVADGGAVALSLGGGITTSDLSLERSGNDLRLLAGGGEGMTLENWFAGSSARPVVTLQVLAQSGLGQPAAASVLTYDLNAAVDAVGTLLQRERIAAGWQVADALACAQSGMSDSAALGGDLAWRYGLDSSFAAVGDRQARSVLGAADFGLVAQSVGGVAALDERRLA